jgi:hypothetical protein
MLAELSNSASSRREFLQRLFPAGALLCSGCGLLSAAGRLQDSPQNKPAQHKFLEDSGLTVSETVSFAFQRTYIPVMQELARRNDQRGHRCLLGSVGKKLCPTDSEKGP